jgi:osmotically-inducible protein OsmY
MTSFYQDPEYSTQTAVPVTSTAPPTAVVRQYPTSRYYYDWYTGEHTVVVPSASDGDIKSEVVDRLRENLYTRDHKLKVNVHSGAVVLEGTVDTALAKRAAGDDAWDTPGVMDVSNQLQVRYT